MIKKWTIALSLMAAAGGALVAQVPNIVPQPAEQAREAAARPVVPGTATLDKTDVNAWLDGFMPYALQRGDIAGAVVLVVKDGAVLTQKGYGYADLASKRKMDPATSLFRPGSMTKMFTWTSIMQLVEQGKIDLDADVNRYLDFKIPAYEGKPVTMRQIMSHVGGFEEASGGLIVDSPAKVPPLGQKLKQWIPARIFAPGTTPAYSNYATALAGYVVERVGGQPFDDYVENHIFKPLSMNHTTMRQPLPAHLAPLMSSGYDKASGKAKPFEIVMAPPAGSGTSSAPDIAKFMIAHLNQGQGLLRPETARVMQNSTYRVFANAPAMSLGWIEVTNHSRRIISHAGDTRLFHTGMWLIPGEGIGLLVSMNSTGHGGATGTIRENLLAEFMRRYVPAQAAPAPQTNREQALVDARMIEGSYYPSRRFETGLRKALYFMSQSVVKADKEGRLTSDNWRTPGEGPERWVHAGPLLWRNLDTNKVLSAKARDGEVYMFAQGPASASMRVPWYEDAAWLRPALIASLVILLLAALAWPFGAVQRRYYAAGRPVAPRRTAIVQRSVAGVAAATLVLLGFWFYFLTKLSVQPLGAGTYVLQIATIILIPGLFALALWRLWLSVKSGLKLSMLWSLTIALAASIVLWAGLAYHLIYIGLAQ